MQIATPTSRQLAAQPYIRAWLYAMAFLIFCMVIVGGATRLTDSGLSITEWQPLLGAIPPLTHEAWMEAFNKYRAIPEYQIINKGMSLEEFEFIYWWEWSHRFLGRFIGIAFFVPLVFFCVTRRIEKHMLPRLVGLFLLGGAQGALGWFMVKSGLVDRVDVSQYRLSAHLTLATIIFAAIIWTALGIGRTAPRRTNPVVWRSLIILGLIIMQVALGGFVAGLDAGMAYNTWPLMDGAFIPKGLLIMEPTWRNFFENAMTVQFQHRIMAYVLFAAIVVHWALTCLKRQPEDPSILWLRFMMLAILIQMGLGIWTLIAQVPISLGLMHQGGALIVLTVTLAHLHHASLREAFRQ